MSRFPIEPHFVYTQDSTYISFPSYDNFHNGNIIPPNSNIWNSLTGPAAVIAPSINLPSLGNTHTHRRGNRITVTSIRLKLSMRLHPRWAFAYQPNTSPVTAKYTDTQIPQLAPSRRFFKMRFMVVQFNDDMTITNEEIASWFFRTYCYFKDDERHIVDDNNPFKEPISVHSNIMRLTTPYTGKFNILMDKPITWYSTRPLQQLDINIPLNKSFVFSEEDQDKLLFPNIWCFLLPPLNFLTDVDPLTRYDFSLYYARPSGPDGHDLAWNFCNIDVFAKLNFVDL